MTTCSLLILHAHVCISVFKIGKQSHCQYMCLFKIVALPALNHPAPQCTKRRRFDCYKVHPPVTVSSVVSQYSVSHGRVQKPSPSLRCQARRPQSKKERQLSVLPSGLSVEHKKCLVRKTHTSQNQLYILQPTLVQHSVL